MLEVGNNVVIIKSLKKGKIIGKQIKKDSVVYEVKRIEPITNKSEGSFIYTERQLSKRP